MEKCALFDFDGTITGRDTLFDFIKFTYGKRGLIRCLLLNFWNLALYALKLRSNENAKEKLLATILKGEDAILFRERCKRYCEERVPQILSKKTAGLIQQHKTEGDKLYIVSASPEDWIAPWALANGFTGVIATQLEKKGGKLTGKFSSRNCYGEEKVNRLKIVFSRRENYYIRAYGDSKGDKPMLGYADEGYFIQDVK